MANLPHVCNGRDKKMPVISFLFTASNYLGPHVSGIFKSCAP
jgi:hypothetical protein